MMLGLLIPDELKAGSEWTGVGLWTCYDQIAAHHVLNLIFFLEHVGGMCITPSIFLLWPLTFLLRLIVRLI
jgi:hypothetical protein